MGNRISQIDSTSAVVFSVIAVMVLVLIIAYIVWRIRRSDLKSVIIVGDPIPLNGSGVPLTIDKSKIPTTMNGQEYSYSFWLYMVQYDPAGAPIVLFGRGMQQIPAVQAQNAILASAGVTAKDAVLAQAASVGAGSPVVYIDKATNKMYISVSKNKTSGTTSVPSMAGSNDYVTATIDYVPLQRWVHVVFVVQDYLMTIFMDGDIYTVSNVTETGSGQGVGYVRPLFGATSGDIIIGATPSKSFLSQLQFFNYGLTQRDVTKRYSQGPVSSSALSVIGIPAYGIRSPVYKIE